MKHSLSNDRSFMHVHTSKTRRSWLVTGLVVLGLVTLAAPNAFADDPEDGSCCVQGECTDNTTDVACGGDGGLFDTRSCEARGECKKNYDVGGSCCAGIQCMDNIEKGKCDKDGGTWSDELVCDARTDCNIVEQSCCINGTCYDTMTEARCQEGGGAFEATSCDARSACELNPPIEGDDTITPIEEEDNTANGDNTPTGGGCASVPSGGAPVAGVLLAGLALLFTRKRSRVSL